MNPNINIPVVNAPYLSVDSCNLVYLTTTTLALYPGTARESGNRNDVRVAAVSPATYLTLSIAAVGANGLDVGTIAASTVYNVFVVGNSYGNPNLPASVGLLSLSATAPVLPAGYDMFRRVGAIRIDASTHVEPFLQTGSGRLRKMWYTNGLSALSGGASATFASVNLSAMVPAGVGCEAIFTSGITPTAAGNTGGIRPSGSTSTAGNVVVNGAVAAVLQDAQVVCPVGVDAVTPYAAAVDYKVTGTLSLTLLGYTDFL